MTILGVLYATPTLLYFGVLALTSTRVKAVLANHLRAPDMIRWGAGSVTVGFGLELAASDNTPA